MILHTEETTETQVLEAETQVSEARAEASEKEAKFASRKNKILTAIGIVFCLLLLPIIIINTVLIVRSYTDPDHIPHFMGYSVAAVLSGSMSGEFEIDSLIIIEDADYETLEEGQIICYIVDGIAVTHRIQEVTHVDGEVAYIAKGDANTTADAVSVLPSQIEGVYITNIPSLGGFVLFLQSTTGILLFVVLPVLIFLIVDFIRMDIEKKKSKQKARELEEELRKIKNGTNPASENADGIDS